MLDQVFTHQFSMIPSRVSRTRIEEVVADFLGFLREVPEDVLRTVHFESPWQRGSAIGYCDARGRKEEDKKDKKEYFHWNPSLKTKPEYRALYKESEAARRFFDHAEAIFNDAARMTAEVFAEPRLAPYRDRCVDQNGEAYNGHLRILCYTPSKDVFRAKGHYDKGLGTIALGESGPGLRIGCCEACGPAPVVHEEGTAIFMPGHLLWEDSRGAIIPAWHDVVPLRETANVSPRCARWAVVFFINDKDGRYPSWEQVHKPLPVHQPFMF